jgi:cytochrome c-type biogenesis protein CcmH/NrfG
MEEALLYAEQGVKLSPKYTDAKVRLAEIIFTSSDTRMQDMASAAIALEPNNISVAI